MRCGEVADDLAARTVEQLAVPARPFPLPGDLAGPVSWRVQVVVTSEEPQLRRSGRRRGRDCRLRLGRQGLLRRHTGAECARDEQRSAPEHTPARCHAGCLLHLPSFAGDVVEVSGTRPRISDGRHRRPSTLVPALAPFNPLSG